MTAKILVVEDEASISMLIRDDLALEGYEVVVAHDGEEGLRLAKETAPDLVVLDVMLPKRSGFEVCRQLKAARKELPIILLTAKGQESDKLAGFEMGADDYLTKPFSMLELLARVKVALRNRAGRPSQAEGRRIAALVMTDIMGYTQKASVVPQEVLMRLMKSHHEMVEGAAKGAQGRVVNTVADSTVVVFERVTDALQAALMIQREHRRFSQAQENPHERLALHVAVHVGEITMGPRGDDMYGDAVNVAARAAKLSDGDTVCVTEAVRLIWPLQKDGTPHLPGQGDGPMVWEDLGPQALKGVEGSLRVFRIKV